MMSPGELPPRPKRFFWIWLLFVALVLILIARDLKLNFTTLVWGYQDIIEYFSRYGRPDFSEWHHYSALMLQTIAIAFWERFWPLLSGLPWHPLPPWP